MKPLVSMIVPVFNAGKFLDKCAKSIVGQSYHNLQIILVDDGSADGSGEICDQYAKIDRRVYAIHKEHGGVTSARKAGIAAALGEFAGWVDADDWIEADYLEQMVQAQMQSGADMVAADHFHDIGASSDRICNHIQPGVYDISQILPELIYLENSFEFGLQPHLVTKLIRTELLKNIILQIDDQICMGEDVAAVYAAALEAKRICVTDICGYHYLQHTGSLTKVRDTNEIERLELLLDYLTKVFREKAVSKEMDKQLAQYEKFYYLMRQFAVYRYTDIFPFGEIPAGSRIVIYGAGVLGQNLYGYLQERRDLTIAAWLDRNWESYQGKIGTVRAPDAIADMDDAYDLVLIANISRQPAEDIRQCLKQMGVKDKKIRWLADEFMQSTDRVCRNEHSSLKEE